MLVNKKLLIVLLLVLFSMSSLIPGVTSNEAYAANDDDGTLLAKENPKCIELTPSSDTYIVLDSVKMLFHNDNSVEISVERTKRMGEKPESYVILVNPETKTYQTQKAEPSKGPRENPMNVGTTGTNYSQAVYVQSVDLPQAPLCESGLWLYWTVNNGNVVSSNRYKDQWDGCPTIFGTHWYLSYHNWEDYYITSNEAFVSSRAKHYNYDFMDPNLPTYAYHNIDIWGYKNGTWKYKAIWDHTGECSYLLGGKVTEY